MIMLNPKEKYFEVAGIRLPIDQKMGNETTADPFKIFTAHEKRNTQIIPHQPLLATGNLL